MEGKAEINMYDFSKQMVQNEVPMDSVTFTQKVSEVAKEMTKKDYFMLLCRERNDYTIFKTDNSSKKIISKELMPTLRNRGTVLLIDKVEDFVWEIWIRDVVTSENFAYYLFDYSHAVIDCCKEDK